MSETKPAEPVPVDINGYNMRILNAITPDRPLGVYDCVVFRITADGIYKYDIYLSRYPTGNCQVSSFGNINLLLAIVKKRVFAKNNINEYLPFHNLTDAIKKELKDDVNAVMLQAYKMAKFNQKLTLLDLQECWFEMAQVCFDIHLRTPYKSSNGSSMGLFFVKIPTT